MKEEKISIFILGARGAGKTSFLTGLSVLSQPNQENQFQLLAKDKPSAKQVTDLRERVRLGEWPSGTVTSTPLDLEVTFSNTTFQLSITDYPGEDLVKLMEVRESQEEETIHNHLVSADCILLLLDPTQDLITKVNQSPREITERRQTALATALGYCVSERLPIGKKVNKPLVYPILTKADLLGETDSHGIVAQENKSLLKQLRDNSRDQNQFKLHPISACGPMSPHSEGFPSDPSPQGYEKLFRRIIDDNNAKKTAGLRLFIYWAVAACLVLAVGGGIYKFRDKKNQDATIKSGTIDELVTVDNPDPDLLDERVGSEIEELKKILSSPNTTLDQLRSGKSELLRIRDVPNHKYKAELDDLLDRFNSRIASSILGEATQLHKSGESKKAKERCLEFKRLFPQSTHGVEIQKILDEISGKEHSKYLKSIREVNATTKEKIATKVKKIEIYRSSELGLSDHDESDVDLAIKTANRLVQADSAVLIFSDLTTNNRLGEVCLMVHKAPSRIEFDDGVKLFEKEKKRASSTSSKDIEIRDSNWANFKVILWDLVRIKQRMAYTDFNLFRDLAAFDGKSPVSLKRYNDWKYEEPKGSFKVKIYLDEVKKLTELTADELKAYYNYIYPGVKW